MKRIAWLFLGTLACGGADQSSLLVDSGQPGPDATQSDTGPGPDAGPVKDSGPVVDTGPIADVVTMDVPVGPPDSKIKCGTTSCSAQTQVCCMTVGNPNTFACVASVNDCQGGSDVPITCSSKENCASQGNPGDVCCGLPNGPNSQNPSCNNFSMASTTQCQTSCDPQQGEFEVGCTLQPNSCTNGMTCITSVCTIPGYTLCK